MLTFHNETVQTLLTEAAPFHVKHLHDVGGLPLPLTPDLNLLEQLQNANILHTFVARDPHQSLVGYALFAITRHHLFQGHTQAQQLLLYVDPPHRPHAIAFLRFIDQQLETQHVSLIRHSVTPQRNFGPVLQRLGYENVEQIYCKLTHRAPNCDRPNT